MSRRGVVLGALGMVTATAACGSTTATNTSAVTGAASAGSAGSGGDKLIGLSLNGNVEYNKNLATGLYKAIDGTNFPVKTVQANFDVNTELTNIQSLLDQGVKGLVINPNTTQGVLSGIKRAHEMGIPVGLATWNQPTVLDEYLTSIAKIDAEGIGKALGEYLKAHATPGPTIVVQGVIGQGYSEGIDKGLDAALAGTGFKVVVRQQGFFDRNKGIGVVQTGLQAHPDTTAIVDYSTVMGNGIASYLKNNGYDKVTHLSTVIDDEALTWLGTPYLSAVCYYSPAETGQIAAEGVRQAIEGKTPTKIVPVWFGMATKDTITQIIKDHPYKDEAFLSKVNLS